MTNERVLAWALVTTSVFASPTLGQTVLRVDNDAAPGGNGLTWATAFNNLENALTAAQGTAKPVEIWIAGGVYPQPDFNGPAPYGQVSFQLTDQTSLLGGFRGLAPGGDPDERDPKSFGSTLTGTPYGDPGVSTLKGQDLSSVILDGLAIGGASSPGVTGGGALNLIDCDAVIRSVSLAGTSGSGGAIWISESNLEIVDSSVVGYGAQTPTGVSGHGGAVYAQGSTLLIIGCSLNGITGRGAAIAAVSSSVEMRGCTIEGSVYDRGVIDGDASSQIAIANTSIQGKGEVPSSGGAVLSTTGPTLLQGCTIKGSQALGTGSLLQCNDLTLVGCDIDGNTLTGNAAVATSKFNCINSRIVNHTSASAPIVTGSGLIVGSLFANNKRLNLAAPFSLGGSTIVGSIFVGNSNGGASMPPHGAVQCGSCTIAGSIFWGNRTSPSLSFQQQQLNGTEAVLSGINFSCLEGWDGTLGGQGNFGLDPELVSPGTGDFSLQPGSPCIDAGDSTQLPPDAFDLDADGDTSEPLPIDLLGNSRRADDPSTPDTGVGPAPVVDIGAIEFQSEACFADCDQSGALNIDDFICFQTLFATGNPDADCDESGSLDIDDFICFQTVYAVGC